MSDHIEYNGSLHELFYLESRGLHVKIIALGPKFTNYETILLVHTVTKGPVDCLLAVLTSAYVGSTGLHWSITLN